MPVRNVDLSLVWLTENRVYKFALSPSGSDPISGPCKL